MYAFDVHEERKVAIKVMKRPKQINSFLKKRGMRKLKRKGKKSKLSKIPENKQDVMSEFDKEVAIMKKINHVSIFYFKKLRKGLYPFV